MTEEKRKQIAVIDGNSLMHRAFHAIPPTMVSPAGKPTGAVFGFLSMFCKLIETFTPDGVICCFDKGKPKVRMEMLPQYKAQRPPMDPSLHEQFPMIKQLLTTMDIPVCELEGWEGDDLLGTIAKKGEREGWDMLLVTGDRDMYQLSTEHIHIVSTRKGISDVSIMTPESVSDLYHGITPDLVPDFYGLKGDSSDNIPGVPGIGPKKASALIVEYGSLDEVIAHADEVKGKMGENLRAHIDDALLSRKVATIRCDAPIAIELSDAHFPTFDVASVQKALQDLGFTGLTKKICAFVGADATACVAAGMQQVALDRILESKQATQALADDVAHKRAIGISFDDGKEADALFGLAHRLWCSTSHGLCYFDDEKADEVLEQLLYHGSLVCCDLKRLMHILLPTDTTRPAKLQIDKLDYARLFDIEIAGYVLDSQVANPDTATLAQKFNIAMPEPYDEYTACAIEAQVVKLLQQPLVDALKKDESYSCFRKIDMPLVGVLCQMERQGVYVDSGKLHEQNEQLTEDINALAKTIHKQAGTDFSIDSPKQLSHMLFDVLELPTTGLKKTKTGYYSTNAKVLENLAQDHEIVKQVLEYREKTKIRSTYLEALPALIAADKRVHTTFHQTVVATGRLSSSNPNLQNIPVHSELGKRVRSAFSVEKDCVFLTCDYSQIELRLLAHLSQDEGLCAAFCEGQDFHAQTAAQIFGVSPSEVTPDMRSRAKAVNFGIVYGQQAYGLSQALGIPRKEAQEMIDRYFEAYPKVREFLDTTVARAHETLYAQTMYGRKRHIPDIAASNHQIRSFGERTAMNHPMQGTSADIIKLAMIQVQNNLIEQGFNSKLILQIHDELDFEVPTNELEVLVHMVKETMENVVELSVPLIAEASWGKTWAEAK